MICLGETEKSYEATITLNNINLKQTDPLESAGTLCVYTKTILHESILLQLSWKLCSILQLHQNGSCPENI